MSSPALVVGVDIGGTTTKAELVDADGHPLSADRRATPAGRGGEPVLATVAQLVGSLAASAPAPVSAVGLAVPGIVDVDRGVALRSANLGWRDVPVREEMTRRLGVPVVVEHDVAAAGLAEQALGAGRGAQDVLVVVIGTGLSAVVIVDGRHVRGRRGQAGELGHMVVRRDGPACGCGGHGCLEAVASAAAIARAYAERTGRPVDGAAEVAARLGADPDADAVWDEAVTALADGLLDAVALLAPERIVVGGGLAEAGELLLAPLRRRLVERATYHSLPDVVPASLGSRAGVVGAALAARRFLASHVEEAS